MTMKISYQGIFPAPFGAVGICMQGDQLLCIDLLSANHIIRPDLLTTHESASVHAVGEQLSRYFVNAKATFQLPHQQSGTPYQQRVWAAICEIPVGQTRTYSQLAQQIGSGPRAVANACGANKLPLLVPCHRVVAKNGLGGFMGGRYGESIAIKRWLLQHEKALQ